MTVVERELREIAKYQTAMEEIIRRCDAGKTLGYKSLQYDFHLQPIGIKALINLGYLEKISHGKYKWKANRQPTPMMARRLYDWMKEYFASNARRQKEMESEKLYEENNYDTEDDKAQEETCDTAKKLRPQFIQGSNPVNNEEGSGDEEDEKTQVIDEAKAINEILAIAEAIAEDRFKDRIEETFEENTFRLFWIPIFSLTTKTRKKL